MKPILFDSGLIVGALIERDQHHKKCAPFLASTPMHLRLLPITVLSEVCILLEKWPETEAKFLAAAKGGSFTIVDLEPADIARMKELVQTYSDFPLGGIDASIVAIAERLGLTDIATIDHRHFRVIKPKHTEAFTLLP